MTRWLAVLFLLTPLTLSACAGLITTERTYHGAGVGAALGATVGILLDRSNDWRGAVLGGALGAAAGGALTEISTRAARDARTALPAQKAD